MLGMKRNIYAAFLFLMCVPAIHAQAFYPDEAETDSVVENIADTLDVQPCTDPEVVVRKGARGIVVVDSGYTVRAMSTFSGAPVYGGNYAAAINRYRREFNDSVRIYSMVVPIAIAYYEPEDSPIRTIDQARAIDVIYDNLDGDVVPVDIYDALWDHAGEPIYARTDHHWAPLGAYYAAEEFCRIAGLPFLQLNYYEPRVVHDWVGTMARFSRDASVRRHPEEFVYYVPQGVDYTTTYITYRLGKKQRVIGENPPKEGEFFVHYNDGSVAAYSTFMGGDARTVKVQTGVPNGRKLMIIKDSFGNALTSFLFASVEEIHVVDFRYFNRNIKEYAVQNGITDIMFVNNISHAYTPSTAVGLTRMLDR